VDEMLRLAGLTKEDVVYDLGSGDGRIVIAAATDYGARGVGVDVDPVRINEARASARKAGVLDRAQFLQQDLFATDLREATVVTLYLLPKLNMRLRPKLLSDLRPGTRVVSHNFSMEDWQPDKELWVTGSSSGPTLYYWVIPADVAGEWRWSLPAGTDEPRYTLRLQQHFQEVSGSVSAEGEEVSITNATLTGDQLRFTSVTGASGRPVTMAFDGHVNGNTIHGRVEMREGASTRRYDWTAQRDADGATATGNH
jgi:SAM-dependent methyltransferase